eukprot:scaffold22619_cov29-Tisochrysis_lutea.AAC.2
MSPAVRAPVVPARCAAPVALDMPSIYQAATLLSEIVDADGERAYGAVDAPGWVLPVGAIVVIGTSLLPILLSPGEEALNKMRKDEQGRFGSRGGINRK